MRGTAHVVIGGASGYFIANAYQVDPTTTVLFIGLAGVSGLIPDLDIEGKLSGKITFSHKIIRTAAQLIGLALILYSFYQLAGDGRIIGMGIGAIFLSIASSIKQKHMLWLTGIGILGIGLASEETWLYLMGIYIIIASFVSHRTYTHSILGVLFFALIAFHLENSLGIKGVLYTCVAGYVSHLIADSKYLPFNKKGVKLFLPLSSKDF